jgi:serine/threonine-protein kinase|tara:strand:- start:5176 stop:6900 length:1725 start_codon:yes stop_codon:yes gene_type:complete
MDIAGYELVEKVGRGGMATVYRGIQLSLNRPVAIKVLFEQFTLNSEVFKRFEQESLIIARLNNPHIINVIDRGITSENTPFFVMDLVEGVDLKHLIKRRELDFNKKIDIATQICSALSYAHRNGVVHRDIKPANVIMDEEGVARVLDFGIAMFNDENSVDNNQTQAGTIMGSMAYMSPEQRQSSDQVTMLSDLYSLGVLMYELFTGRRPGGNCQMPSEMDSSLPKKLDSIITRCIDEDPGNRPTSAEEVKTQLLMLSGGTHLDSQLKQSAVQDLSALKDRFTLLDVIQENEFGAVYLFEENSRKQPLVIKMRKGAFDGYMESKLLTSLKHQNIINILGTSKNERVFILVMEFVKGGCLQDRLTRPLPLAEFMPIAKQICDGLAFAQQNRIRHGNLRPTNILFDGNRVKVADFGLNEHYGDTAQKNWYRPVGEEKSHRTDIYALGIIFKQMLTGSTPDCPAEDLPNAIVPLITKMTEPDPAERYGRFSEVSADLKNLDENGEQVFIELDLGEQEVLPPSFSFGRWLLGVTAICIASLLSYAFYSFDVDWTDLTSRAEHDAQEARLEDDGWRDLSE